MARADSSGGEHELKNQIKIFGRVWIFLEVFGRSGLFWTFGLFWTLGLFWIFLDVWIVLDILDFYRRLVFLGF